MNGMEEFLNFCAVVKIRRNYDDDLYKFIELMKNVGFLKHYAEHFEKSCCSDKEFNEFSEDVFWHYVKRKYESYIKTGEDLKLLDKESKRHYEDWFQGIIKENKVKDTMEINNDI